MMEFKLKNGEVVKYDRPFQIDDKFIRKFNCIRDGDTEGPWMWVHPDDVEAHDKDSTDRKVRLGVAANACLNGIPWGAVFPYVLQGSRRPVCNMNELIDFKSELVFCQEAFLAPLDALLKDKDAATPDMLAFYTRVLGEDHPAVLKFQAVLAEKGRKCDAKAEASA